MVIALEFSLIKVTSDVHIYNFIDMSPLLRRKDNDHQERFVCVCVLDNDHQERFVCVVFWITIIKNYLCVCVFWITIIKNYLCVRDDQQELFVCVCVIKQNIVPSDKGG